MQPVKSVWSILDFDLKARILSSHEGPEAVMQRCSVKKLFLEILQLTGKHMSQSLIF